MERVSENLLSWRVLAIGSQEMNGGKITPEKKEAAGGGTGRHLHGVLEMQPTEAAG
jgi:hypothetical protein